MTNIITRDLPDMPVLLTAEEVAEILKTSRATAYNLMRQREIPVVQLGRAVRVREVDLREYIERQVQR